MIALRTFKFRLYPNKSQRRKLQASLDACRWVYNQTLGVRRYEWQTNQNSISLFDTNTMLVEWKESKPELKDGHSQALQDAQARVQRAFENFWRRCREGGNPGYPRFKPADRYKSFTFKQSGFQLIGDRILRVSKIGDIKIKRHREITGVIKRATLIRNACGEWSVCLQCETEVTPRENFGPHVGIDVGVKVFAALSDGSVVENPKFLKRDAERLAKAKRQLSESPEGSKRRAKKTLSRDHVWKRIVNRREDFAHQLSHRIVNGYGSVAVEELNIVGLIRMNFNDMKVSIRDAAWGRFRQLLTYKAEEAGCQLVAIDPRNTTQMCSSCFDLVPKELGDRVHSCPHCGLVMDRDLNASLNIERLGLESLGCVAHPQHVLGSSRL